MSLRTVDRLEDLPDPAPDADFVVVDVIISSTTIVRLLEAGARYVKPFADPERAREFKAETENALLVGEDGGGPIPGFDLSPLPSIIADADIADRPVGIRTSNGTRAIDRLGYSDRIFVGSTINAAAVAEVLHGREGETWVVAAGRQGSPTPEDTAGSRLIAGHYDGTLTDHERESSAADVRDCSTADWLRDAGYEHEVDALLDLDSTDTVPQLRDGRFVPA